MAYTVKSLSKLSGVTVRTLYFYEEIGLLKPAYYGSNGYRYYEDSELLRLQQILFFKELGFSLKQIQKVIGKSDFDQLAALYSHQRGLSQEWERMRVLLKTIDKTIKHLKGKKKMKDKEMFDGFNITLVKANGSAAEKLIAQSVKDPTKSAEDVAKRGKLFYENITKGAHEIFRRLVQCMQNGFEPSDAEVQEIIKKHHALTQETLHATREVYKALAQLYVERDEFRKQLDPFHSHLAEYMAKAMIIFVDS